MNHLREGLSQSWLIIQGSLFPWLQEGLGQLTEKQQQLVMILEIIRIEEHLNDYYGGMGRPPKSRAAIARAFIAKMVYNMPTTRMLLERLESDKSLRRLCGWEYRHQVPHESVFYRANHEFSERRLPERVHEAMIQTRYEKTFSGHISRDSTAIHAREKAAKKEAKVKPAAKKRGRPKKGEVRPKTITRIERQVAGMPLTAMLTVLSNPCDIGTKQNSKGYKNSWIGISCTLIQPMAASPSVACCHLRPCMTLKLPFHWQR